MKGRLDSTETKVGKKTARGRREQGKGGIFSPREKTASQALGPRACSRGHALGRRGFIPVKLTSGDGMAGLIFVIGPMLR